MLLSVSAPPTLSRCPPFSIWNTCTCAPPRCATGPQRGRARGSARGGGAGAGGGVQARYPASESAPLGAGDVGGPRGGE